MKNTPRDQVVETETEGTTVIDEVAKKQAYRAPCLIHINSGNVDGKGTSRPSESGMAKGPS